MRRLSPRIAVASAAMLFATLPAWAHVTAPATAHLHASDFAGVAVVVALTVAAGWIDRRLQRARRRPRDAVARQRRGDALAGRAAARVRAR